MTSTVVTQLTLHLRLILAIAAVIYTCGVILIWRPVAGHAAWLMARQSKRSQPHPAQWVLGIIGGAAVAGIWPVELTAWILYKLIPRIPHITIGAEAQAVRQRQVEHRASLERTLDL